MPIYERLHNEKKQWRFRCYYTDFNGDRVQRNSKWFNTKKEAVAAESAFMQIKVVGDQDVSFYEITLKWIIDNTVVFLRESKDISEIS